MATVEKLSVTLTKEDVEWAREQARERGVSLSAVLSATVRDARQFEARREYVEWALQGQPPLTAQELAEVDEELYGTPKPDAATTPTPTNVRVKRASR